jgi:drug/metabolite transporter (DMT)-like permease
MQTSTDSMPGLANHPLIIHASLLLTAMIWGANFVAMKYLVVQIGAPQLLLLRVMLASAAFSLILFASRKVIPRFTPQAWRLLALVGLFGIAINQLAVIYGTSYLSAALASLIATSTPIFTTLISRVWLGDRLTQRKITGIALSFTGFLIVLLFGSGSAQFSVDNAIGVMIIICAPFSWAVSTVISKPLMMENDPKVVTALSSMCGALIVLPLLFFHPGVFAEVAAFDARSWLAALTTSILAVVVGYTLWYRGLRRLEPTQVAVYVYMVPFFGVLFSWLLLGESITLFLLLGGATILAGVIVTNSSRPPAISTPSAAGTPVAPAAALVEEREGSTYD